MVAYHYDFRIALVKGSPNVAAANATVLVYDPLDVTYSTPISVYSDPGLTTIVNLVTDQYGIIPDFWSDKPDLLWKSGALAGGWATTSSRPGIRGLTGAEGPEGPMGPNGTAGLNGQNGEVARWETGLAYTVGFPVINPSGDLVKVTTAHTSGGTYDPLMFSTPYDTAVTSLVNTPTSETRVALDPIYAARVDDRGYSTLQAAVDAAPIGGTLEIRRAWVITAALTVTKAIRITCARGGTITTSGSSTRGFDVTASDVTFEGVTLIGTGSGTAGTSTAIRVIGTEAAPVRNLVIRGCTIREFNKYALEVTSAKDFTISGNLIENISYAAVMILAGVKGYILSNTIKNLVQPTGFVNSYGIAMTRDSTKSLALSPRSADIVCSGNIVDGVPGWEGIDTHGGENLTITNNKVTNTKVGIALVPGADTVGAEIYAPKNIIVTGNLLDSGKTDGTAAIGVQLIGCITTVDNVVEYASAVISDNIIRNHGTQNVTSQAGIFLQATRGALVSKNRIVDASPNGINLNNNNQGTLVLDNTIVDTWTTAAAFTACVYVPGVHQSVTVQGNRAVRADKTATLVNNRGLYFASALLSPDVTVQYGSNHFKECTLPIVDSTSTQNITEQRIEARKISFYPGITPVARQTIAAAATDAATTQTLANDLRTKMIALGLVS